MTNPLLKIHQPQSCTLAKDGTLHIGMQWGASFSRAYTVRFQRLQREVDGEFVRLVKPYIPKRTGALVGSTDAHTVLGSGQITQATPYAAAQYYRLPLGVGVRADGRGPHWGERCVNDNRSQFIEFVHARAKEEFK